MNKETDTDTDRFGFMY